MNWISPRIQMRQSSTEEAHNRKTAIQIAHNLVNVTQSGASSPVPGAVRLFPWCDFETGIYRECPPIILVRRGQTEVAARLEGGHKLDLAPDPDVRLDVPDHGSGPAVRDNHPCSLFGINLHYLVSIVQRFHYSVSIFIVWYQFWSVFIVWY